MLEAQSPPPQVCHHQTKPPATRWVSRSHTHVRQGILVFFLLFQQRILFCLKTRAGSDPGVVGRHSADVFFFLLSYFCAAVTVLAAGSIFLRRQATTRGIEFNLFPRVVFHTFSRALMHNLLLLKYSTIKPNHPPHAG